MIEAMRITGIIMIVLGSGLIYLASKKKIVKGKPGQTLRDMHEGLLNTDPDAAIRRGMNMGCGVYLKLMGIAGGIGLVVIGALFLLLGLAFAG